MRSIISTVPYRLTNLSRVATAFEVRLFNSYYGRRIAAVRKNVFDIYNPERI